MEYKARKPDAPGYYWMRWRTDPPVEEEWASEIVRVFKRDDKLMVREYNNEGVAVFPLFMRDYNRMQFAGPIESPEPDDCDAELLH